MQRRHFSLTCASVVGGALAGSALSANAQVGSFKAGSDYQVLEPRAPVEAPAGKIEVVEFFWYNCPHCNAFEPSFSAWAKKLPKDVVLRRAPVAFQSSFEPQQRLYYALEAMGLVEKLHAKVFVAIHAEKQKLDQPAAIADWIAKQGVDKTKFMEQFNSFSSATKASRAAQLQNAYKVPGVPALGVAGRYLTDGDMAKSLERALQVVDALVASVRSGK